MPHPDKASKSILEHEVIHRLASSIFCCHQLDGDILFGIFRVLVAHANPHDHTYFLKWHTHVRPGSAAVPDQRLVTEEWPMSYIPSAVERSVRL
jgi:hypothetical protein